MKRRSKLTITIMVFLSLVLSLTSSVCLAQDSDPPINLDNQFDSGTIAVVVLIVMLVERLLGKILPYFTKSDKEDPAVDAIKMLCDELKYVKVTTAETNIKVKDTSIKVNELHEWHNVPDPMSGRMIWSGSGLAKLENIMVSLNDNIKVQTNAMRDLTKEDSQAHGAILNSIHEMLQQNKK